jgi:hypothetical protein
MHILESIENLFNGSTYVVTNSGNRFQQEHIRLAIYERINMRERAD